MKVRLAVCKSEDIETFRAELRGYRGAIEVLLLTLQMCVRALPIRPSRCHASAELMGVTGTKPQSRLKCRRVVKGRWRDNFKVYRSNGWKGSSLYQEALHGF